MSRSELFAQFRECLYSEDEAGMRKLMPLHKIWLDDFAREVVVVPYTFDLFLEWNLVKIKNNDTANNTGESFLEDDVFGVFNKVFATFDNCYDDDDECSERVEWLAKYVPITDQEKIELTQLLTEYNQYRYGIRTRTPPLRPATPDEEEGRNMIPCQWCGSKSVCECIDEPELERAVKIRLLLDSIADRM